MTPIYDMHCDMPAYLAYIDKLDPFNEADIGCAIPHLQRGNVQLQVMAIFSPPRPQKKNPRTRQVKMYRRLLKEFSEYVEPLLSLEGQPDFRWKNKIKLIAAIENATVFCNEKESLDEGFRNLEKMIDDCGRPLYISFTHWSENRFGGGNDCHTGLKPDGEKLLEYLDGKRIAVDFAHASDELAHDILNFIEKHSLDIRVMASHSNFRSVCDHERNLPDELTDAIIDRKGLIGMNFMRPYIDIAEPQRLVDHVLYGLERGAWEVLCFGADFFYEKPLLEDGKRESVYFPEHCNAGKLPKIIENLQVFLTQDELSNLCRGNVERFIKELLAD